VLLSGPLPFDGDAWCADTRVLFSYPRRYRMARDGALHARLLGMSVDEARAVLDCPHERGIEIGEGLVVYSVRRVNQSQYQFLQLQYDENRVVRRVVPPGPVR